MPYFRWLGPTAIMPGFKQMVVKVKRKSSDRAATSSNSSSRVGVGNNSTHCSPLLERRNPEICGASGASQTTYSSAKEAQLAAVELPIYDSSPLPPSELITELANTFFVHLGCNYPFLQRDRFLKDLAEKRVDAMLVDAVCALAARFSTHPLLVKAAEVAAAEAGEAAEDVALESVYDGDDDGDTSEAIIDDTDIGGSRNRKTRKKSNGNGASEHGPAEYGHGFAQRAKVALTEQFHCPSIAAAQAALLLAYNEFGEQKDSGLWMYLGIAIRIAQDLGMHKADGLKYIGTNGPTPRDVKDGSEGSFGGALDNEEDSERPAPKSRTTSASAAAKNHDKEEEQRANEQEHVDTFWAIYFLDRVVSSGTGRRSTLLDEDIELSFPVSRPLTNTSIPRMESLVTDSNSAAVWPAPFPALIRIVHLYGRVADLLNGIKSTSDITPQLSRRLAAMENQVTTFYQALSPRLHFDAVNFQHYMRAGEGTNFILLHFWFHSLIILVHQPTLLKAFENQDNSSLTSTATQPPLRLFPHSHQLSMSSAKTIADILAYSQLMDAKASLGNPFTSQPIYIAARVFLKEVHDQNASSAAHSRATSPSRARDPVKSSPSPASAVAAINTAGATTEYVGSSGDNERAATSSTLLKGKSHTNGRAHTTARGKHALLATAATQHYQLCCRALRSLETYWAGTKYIITVLTQQYNGIHDPLLYTAEEGARALEIPRPRGPAFAEPGWRRRASNLFNAVSGGVRAGLVADEGQFDDAKGDRGRNVATGSSRITSDKNVSGEPVDVAPDSSTGLLQPPFGGLDWLPKGFGAALPPSPGGVDPNQGMRIHIICPEPRDVDANRFVI